MENNHKEKKLKVIAWNSRGFGNSQLYMRHLSTNCDIMVITEHHLYSSQTQKLGDINGDMDFCTKSSSRLKNINVYNKFGEGGVAIFWKKKLNHLVRPLMKLGSDRLLVIEINGPVKWYIVAVYLPQQACAIASFHEELAQLQTIITKLTGKGSILIVGDFNCHLGEDCGKRGWGTTTPQGRLLKDICMENQLEIADLSDRCSGPKYTYMSYQGHCSYIDHCIVDKMSYGKIKAIRILEENITNTSDHLPLEVEFLRSDDQLREMNTKRTNICWRKASEEQIRMYRTLVEDKCAMLLSDQRPCLQSVTAILMEAGEKTIPHTSYDRKLKPYWTDEVKKTNMHNKEARRKWLEAGRPRGVDTRWKEYKKPKAIYRAAIRSKIREKARSSS